LLHPWPLKLLIDHVLSGKPLPDWARTITTILPSAQSPLGLALYVAIVGVVLFCVDAALDVVNTRTWISTGQKLVYALACRIFAHAQRLSIIRHSRMQVGDLIARIAGDSWCIYNVASAAFFAPVQAIIMLAMTFWILWNIHPTLALAALAIAPPMALIAALGGRWSRRAHRGERDSEAKIQSHVQQTLAGIPLVQSFAQEERHLRELLQLSGAAVRAQRLAALLGGISHLLAGGVTAIGSALVMVVGARLVMRGQLTVGDLLVFLAYVGLLHAELTNLLGSYVSMEGARASLDRVAELLDQPIEIADPLHPRALPADHAVVVELKNVTFGYELSRAVLQNVNVVVHRGETVAIVGPSGGGKSTIALLLSRLIDPQSGIVLVHGIDARTLGLEQLRACVRVVLQEPFLQGGSVRENLALADPAASEASLVRASELAGAADFVAALEDGLNGDIGEAGSALSGGQQQRLSLARGLLGDPPVLVLDEPTSMLDAGTESAVITAILRHRRALGLTTIIISHRTSAVREADRVLTVDAGRLHESRWRPSAAELELLEVPQ
jgi:ABC-type multidrug transport system fused ATPase/permease subunit